MDGWTENIYSIFRDKLLLLGELVQPHLKGGQIPYLMMKSYTFISYDLTNQIWLKNSIHIPSYVVITYQINVLSSDSLILGHFWSQNDVITPWLRLTVTTNCFLHQF